MNPSGQRSCPHAILLHLLLGWALATATGCGAPRPLGHLAIELTFTAPQPAPLRGVLSGIVDTVRVEVHRKGRLVAGVDCDYEALACEVLQVQAGGGYQVTAAALQAGETVYRGSTADLKVSADELTPVAIVMEPAYEQDRYPPAAVGDLAADVDGAGIELTWTATGNDGQLGRADHYLIYWALDPLAEDTLAEANLVDGPTPGGSGLAQSLRVSGLTGGQIYHFALKVVDGADNASALSNGASAVLP